MAKKPTPKRGRGKGKPSPRGAWAGYELPADFPPEARDELNRLIDRLRAVRMLSRVDPATVVNLARINCALNQAWERIERDSVYPEHDNHTRYKHPLLSVVNSLTLRQHALSTSMGLIDRGQAEPSAAPSEAEEGEADNRWADLIKFSG